MDKAIKEFADMVIALCKEHEKSYSHLCKTKKECHDETCKYMAVLKLRKEIENLINQGE